MLVKLLCLLDDRDESPSLGLRERSGFHHTDLIADVALVVLVVHMDLGGVLNDLPLDGVSDIVLDGNNDGLVHLVANDATHAGFSQVTFFGHDSVPLMHSFRGERSSRERYRA